MSVCDSGIIPHLYSQEGLAGKTVNWLGTDSKYNADCNWQNPETKQQMILNGWDHNTVIEYKFNQNCFRTDEFDNSSRIMILGCSFTIGVGLHLNQTWPERFSKLTGNLIWNLATGSASMDTCYRVLKHYLPYLNVNTVIMCDPGNNGNDRFELWTNHNGAESVITVLNPDQDNGQYCKDWFSSDKNATIQYEKNLDAMQNVCTKSGVRFMHFHRYDASKKYYNHVPDKSRCLKHLGPNSHDIIAQYAQDLFLS